MHQLQLNFARSRAGGNTNGDWQSSLKFDEGSDASGFGASSFTTTRENESFGLEDGLFKEKEFSFSPSDFSPYRSKGLSSLLRHESPFRANERVAMLRTHSPPDARICSSWPSPGWSHFGTLRTRMNSNATTSATSTSSLGRTATNSSPMKENDKRKRATSAKRSHRRNDIDVKVAERNDKESATSALNEGVVLAMNTPVRPISCVYCGEEVVGQQGGACPVCHLFIYCSAKHQQLDISRHRAVCSDMRALYLDDLKNAPVVNLPPDNTSECLLATTTAATPMIKVKHWKSYFAKRGFEEKLLQSSRILRHLTDQLTYPLTIAYSIQKLMATSADFRLPHDRPFYVNILGASYQLESIDACHWKELAYLFPKTDFSIHLIGSGISAAKHGSHMRVSSRMSVWYYRGSYGSYRSYHERNHTAVAQAGMIDADIVMNFCSGVGSRAFHLQDEWQSDLMAVIESNVPAVYTSYSEKELRKDVAFLSDGMKAIFEVESQMNPFRSLAKTPNPFLPETYYQENLYIFIVRGSTSSPGANEVVKRLQHKKKHMENEIQGFFEALDVSHGQDLSTDSVVVTFSDKQLLLSWMESPEETIKTLHQLFEKKQGKRLFIEFVKFNKELYKARASKAKVVSMSFRTKGQDDDLCRVPLNGWSPRCFACGEKALFCCIACGGVWYCKYKCRQQLHALHEQVCDSSYLNSAKDEMVVCCNDLKTEEEQEDITDWLSKLL